MRGICHLNDKMGAPFKPVQMISLAKAMAYWCILYEAVSKVYLAKTSQNIIGVCAFFVFSCDKTNHRRLPKSDKLLYIRKHFNHPCVCVL